MWLRRFLLAVAGLIGVACLAALLARASTASASMASAQPALNHPAPAPTLDRLAAPPTVANPSQADVGAQLFWLHCQPCHGDQAQGLTDEWRAQYPPEDQNCWKSGCHGDRPYSNGFTLPHLVPALVGPGTLSHFGTAADLYAFISHAMPFQAPASLKQEEYWAITAFVLRGHGLGAAALPITDAAVAQRIGLGTPGPSSGPSATPTPPNTAPAGPVGPAFVVVGGLVILGAAGWAAWRIRQAGAKHG